MAHLAKTRNPGQHYASAVAGQVPGAQSGRERLGVHAQQLAVQSHLQILRRSPRSLLRILEQTHRPTLAHHVHRNAKMGSRVLISGNWYNLIRGKGSTAIAMIDPKDVLSAFPTRTRSWTRSQPRFIGGLTVDLPPATISPCCLEKSHLHNIHATHRSLMMPHCRIAAVCIQLTQQQS
jgi:hypothetical protein